MHTQTVSKTIVNFLKSYTPFCTHALTMQMNLPTLNASDAHMEYLHEQATKNVTHFINRVAYKAYGNGAKRKPNKYSPLIITTIEGTLNTYDTNRTLHAHMAIGNIITPNSNIKTEEQLLATIKTEWLNTTYGNKNILVEKMHSTGWINYITKELYNGNMDCISWENTRIPHAALLI